MFRLIRNRLAQDHLVIARSDNRIARRIKLDLVRALECEPHRRRIGAALHDQVVFELSAISVINEIDSRIDRLVTDS